MFDRPGRYFVFLTALNLLAACGGEPEAPEAASPSAHRPASLAGFESGATSSEDLPAGHPSIEEGAVAIAPADAGAELSWNVPDGWLEEVPSSSMRKAQYSVPSETGAAELVVFYFGPGQGGDARSNAQRWAQQFSQPDGSSPLDALKTEEIEVNGMKTLLVETTGSYSNSMAPMASAAGASQSGQMLLASIVQGPDANWFFKLTGPQETVESQREAFLELTHSVRQGP